MPIVTSSEFIALCRSQIAVLTQGLGACLCGVYLTEQMGDARDPAVPLVPVVLYPENFRGWDVDGTPVLSSGVDAKVGVMPPSSGSGSTAEGFSSSHLVSLSDSAAVSGPMCLSNLASPSGQLSISEQLLNTSSNTSLEALPEKASSISSFPPLSPDPFKDGNRMVGSALAPVAPQENGGDSGGDTFRGRYPYQAVVPLLCGGMGVGVLVTGRDDRPWNGGERGQIEQIARTLAIAYGLDQRAQWLEATYLQHQNQYQQVQTRQRTLLDDGVHQLRNPLTAVRTFGKLLLKRLLPGDGNRDVAASIVRESDRLAHLLQELQQAVQWDGTGFTALPEGRTSAHGSLFDITAQRVMERQTGDGGLGDRSHDGMTAIGSLPGLSSGVLTRQSIMSVACSVCSVLEPILAAARAIALERDLAVVTDCSDGLPLVQADAQVLEEVLNNLVDNALKYTAAGGRVWVQSGLHRPVRSWVAHEFSAESSEIVFQGIAVGDTGLPIPEADVQHIFERHYRGVQSERTIPGTGLGLAIARDLVTRMGGVIELVQPPAKADWFPLPPPSIPLDQGKVFVVWLPQVGDRDG